MVCIGGSVSLNKAGHRLAYCAQNPCKFLSRPFYVSLMLNDYLGLEHATIKDNIIFGSSTGYDEARYQSVVQACALIRDLEVLDAGDLTGRSCRVLLQFLNLTISMYRDWREGNNSLGRSKG